MNEFEDTNAYPSFGDEPNPLMITPPPKNENTSPVLDSFWAVVRGFNDVYFDLDRRPAVAVRKDLEQAYDALKVVGAAFNVSALSIPQLKLCCGRSRQDQGPAPAPDKSFGVGDLLKRFFSWLGFRQCAECKKRQGFFNRWRLRI